MSRREGWAESQAAVSTIIAASTLCLHGRGAGLFAPCLGSGASDPFEIRNRLRRPPIGRPSRLGDNLALRIDQDRHRQGIGGGGFHHHLFPVALRPWGAGLPRFEEGGGVPRVPTPGFYGPQ